MLEINAYFGRGARSALLPLRIVAEDTRSPVPHPSREQRLRQRLNWFRKAQELQSVTETCVVFGISRKTDDKWRRCYTTSQGDRLSLADRSRRPHSHPRQVRTRRARRLRRWGPRSPRLNGKVERSHRIDAEEFYRVWRCRTFAELVKAHRRFNHFYNTARPHGGHGGLMPLERLR